MTTHSIEMTADAHDLCAREDLASTLDYAFNLIQEHFPESDHLNVDAMIDPEDDSEYLVVDVRAHGTPKTLLYRELRFLDVWSTRVSWPAVDKLVVRLIPV